MPGCIVLKTPVAQSSIIDKAAGLNTKRSSRTKNGSSKRAASISAEADRPRSSIVAEQALGDIKPAVTEDSSAEGVATYTVGISVNRASCVSMITNHRTRNQSQASAAENPAALGISPNTISNRISAANGVADHGDIPHRQETLVEYSAAKNALSRSADDLAILDGQVLQYDRDIARDRHDTVGLRSVDDRLGNSGTGECQPFPDHKGFEVGSARDGNGVAGFCRDDRGANGRKAATAGAYVQNSGAGVKAECE